MKQSCTDVPVRPSTFTRDLWRALICPHPDLTDLDVRRQSSLLAGLIIAILLTSMVGQAFLLAMNKFDGTLVMAQAALIAIYLLNRRGCYRMSAALMVCLQYAAVYLGAVISGDIDWLMFSPTTVILSALLMPSKVTLFVIVSGGLLQLVFAVAWPQRFVYTAVLPFVAFLLTTALLVVYSVHRRAVEREREQSLRRSEERFRSLVKNSSDVITLLDDQARAIYHSASIRRILGYAPEDLIGRSVFELLHPEDVERLWQAFAEWRQQLGTSVSLEFPIRRADQTWIHLEVVATNLLHDPVIQAVVVNSREITERKAAENEILALNEELRRRSAQLKILNEIGREISVLGDLNSTLQNVLEKLRRILPLDAFFVLLYDAKTNIVSYPIVYDDGRFYDQAPGVLTRGSMTSSVLETGQPVLLNRTPEQMAEVMGQKMLLGDDSRVSASLLMAPLPLRGQIIGAVSAQSYTPNAYEQRHLDLLVSAAHQIAIALNNAQLYDSLRKELTERQQAQEEVQKLNAELEQRVQQRTAELQVINAELEAFAYSVSHDLRAPLRAIEGFSRIIDQDYSTALPEKAQHYFNRIRLNAQRMDDLIRDLLTFSRASRHEMRIGLVDMGTIVRQTIEELGNNGQIGRAEITIEPLPTCRGDAGLLRQVWANLLSNAIKYSRNRPQPQIRVGCCYTDGQPVYFVQDNGTGFDMQYAGRLFNVFQRLHSEEYEGTGVGLATVRRIIQKHGGRIWAEAAVDQGATFYFTVPVTSQQPQAPQSP